MCIHHLPCPHKNGHSYDLATAEKSTENLGKYIECIPFICNDKLVLQEKPKNHKQTVSGFCIMRYTCVLGRFHRNGSYSTSLSTRKNKCFSGIILIMPLVV